MNTKQPKPKDDRLTAAGAHIVRLADDKLQIWHDKAPSNKIEISAQRLESWVKRQVRGGLFV